MTFKVLTNLPSNNYLLPTTLQPAYCQQSTLSNEILSISNNTSKATTPIPAFLFRPSSCPRRIGHSSLDDAREALSEYLALLSPTPEPESFTTTGLEGIAEHGGGGDTTSFSAPDKVRGVVGAPAVDIDKSLKAVLKLYGRAVDVLRDKQERELLTEALCDLGDLHVS